MKEFNFCIDENIVLLEQAVSHLGNTKIVNGRTLSNSLLKESQCNILFTRSQTKVNNILCDGTQLEFVATATAGFDHVDIDYLNSKNIIFSSAPGCNANSVAEYVIFSILKWSILNNIDHSKKKIGIIGFGNIGKLVAKYAYWAGFEVLINDPPLFDNHFDFPKEYKYCELEEILSESDIITNHVPLENNGNYPTYKLLNSNNLHLVKPHSLFLHCSRGGVVNEKVLLDLIENNDLTVVIDVWENEPNFNPLLASKAMIATPHIAGYSYNGKLKGTLQILDSFEKTYKITTDKTMIFKELEYYSPADKSIFQDKIALYNLISDSRHIDFDVEQFRNIINLDESERKIQFDMLRKNYPLRKEVL